MTGPHPAGDTWTADDDRTLMAMIAAKTPVAVIARKLKRTIGAVRGIFTRRGLPLRDDGRRGDAGAD